MQSLNGMGMQANLRLQDVKVWQAGLRSKTNKRINCKISQKIMPKIETIRSITYKIDKAKKEQEIL